MPKKNSYLTITDQFCGAGGSSQGAKKVLDRVGGEIKLALNHWKLAIETHNTNFPDTLHDCTDISACDPRRYPSTDILITSPECTTHSPAGGNNHKTLKKQMDLFNSGKIDPATERSRATMWDVCRFAEYHNYRCIIVENVVEAKTRWALFDVWLMAMHKLGYNHQCVYLNSMHCHPTPQSRDRMYVVFWKKGNPAPNLDHTPTAYCTHCIRDVQSVQTWKDPRKKWGKYKKQYVYCCPTCTRVVEPYYYASMNVIDWTNIGKKIGERDYPLSPKTIARIQYGLDKYGKAPFHVNNQQTTGIGFRVRNMNDHFPTVATSHSMSAVFPQPFIIKLEHAITSNVNAATEAMRPQTTHHSQMLVRNIRSTLEYLQTQTTTQGQAVVIPPFLTESFNNGSTREVTGVLNTATAGGVKTGLVTHESFNAFISYYNGGSNMASHYTEAMGTQATKERHQLITYQQPTVEDCYYRMLDKHEIKLSMAFDRDYVVLGTAKEQVRQCGNAVTPPAMELLVDQCVKSLS